MGDWKSVVGTVAPTIATALGGPLAGAAVAALGSIFGLSSAASDKDIGEAIKKATPDQLLQLKQAEQAFIINMEKLGVDVYKIDADDRNSARKRETDSKDVWTPRLMAILAILLFLLTSGFIGFMLWLKFTRPEGEIDAGLMGLVGSVNGFSGAYVKQSYDYYFGSSRGSSEKNQMLYQSTPQG